MSLAFELWGVCVRRGGTTILDEVDLAVEPGEVVGLVGPSGAGKTTLLGLLNGTVRPDEGEVRVGGRPLCDRTEAQLRQLRADIGLLPQQHGLVPTLRVLQNVLAGQLGRRSLLASLRHVFLPDASEREQVHRLLASVGIAEKLYAFTAELSGGEQQRVALARALHQHPRALLADEPVASVDPARGAEILARIVSLAEGPRNSGVTVVVSLHDVQLARTLPRLVGLRAGRLAFDRSPADLSAADFDALYALDPR